MVVIHLTQDVDVKLNPALLDHAEPMLSVHQIEELPFARLNMIFTNLRYLMHVYIMAAYIFDHFCVNFFMMLVLFSD